MLCLKLIFQVEVGVFGWTVVVESVDRLKICHHMKAVENKSSYNIASSTNSLQTQNNVNSQNFLQRF
jgi:hypothetical protein